MAETATSISDEGRVRSMAKCKNCTNLYNMSNENDEIVGKWCPKTNDSHDVESERECRHYKCMTQADRIRSMSDEELAKGNIYFVSALHAKEGFHYTGLDGHYYKKAEDVVEANMKWLQSEVEE